MGLYLGGDSPECESGECNFFGHIAWEFGNGVPLVLGCVPIGGLVVGLVVRLTRDRRLSRARSAGAVVASEHR